MLLDTVSKKVSESEEIKQLKLLLEKERALRMQSQQVIREKEKQLEEKQKQIKTQEKENKNILSKLKEEESEKNKYKEESINKTLILDGLAQVMKAALENRLQAEEQMLCRYVSNFDGAADRAIKVIENYILSVNTLVQQLAQCKTTFFSHGNEKIDRLQAKEKDSPEKLAITLNTAVRGGKFEKRAVGKLYEILRDIGVDAQNPFFDLLNDIGKSEALRSSLQKKIQPAKVNRGRVNNKGELNQRTYGTIPPVASSEPQALKRCQICESDRIVSIGEIEEELKTWLSQEVASAFTAVVEKHRHSVYYCKDCGAFSVPYRRAEDHPIVPGREISAHTTLSVTGLMAMGLPVQRASSAFEKAAKLGSDTVNYSVHDFVRIYLNPLYNELVKVLKTQPIIFADETTWDCLQDQGRGKLPKGVQPTEARSKNYILAYGTAAHTGPTVRLFQYMKTRSADNIKKILTDDFGFETLVTDGYSAYRNVMSEHPSALHQTCLVHFRRTLLEAIRPDSFIKETAELSREQIGKLLKEKMNRSEDAVKLLLTLNCVSQIFRLEQVKKQYEPGSSESKQAHKSQSALFKNVRKLMNELSQERVEQKGSTRKARRSDYLAKACVYYKNNEESLSAFMQSDKIPIDTNPIEQAIRKIAIYRQACRFKQNPQYVQDMCVIMSVYATLRNNGVPTPLRSIRISWKS